MFRGSPRRCWRTVSDETVAALSLWRSAKQRGVIGLDLIRAECPEHGPRFEIDSA
jgi:hypothetical protein